AVFHLTRLLQSKPESPDLRSRRAHAYVQLSRLREALTDAAHVLAAQPDNVRALRSRAAAQAGLGRWEAALKDWERGVQLAPNDEQTWYELGLAHLWRKDVKSYREHCRRMLQQFARAPDARDLDRVASLAVVLPNAVPETESLVALAERASWSTSGET